MTTVILIQSMTYDIVGTLGLLVLLFLWVKYALLTPVKMRSYDKCPNCGEENSLKHKSQDMSSNRLDWDEKCVVCGEEWGEGEPVGSIDEISMYHRK